MPQYLLIGDGHGASTLQLGNHVGLVAECDVNFGGSKPAWFSIHLHGHGFVGGHANSSTLCQSLSMTTNVKCCLATDTKMGIQSVCSGK